jgi:hypothetical protein
MFSRQDIHVVREDGLVEHTETSNYTCFTCWPLRLVEHERGSVWQLAI